MAEISQIEVNNTTYNVYDAAAQDCLSDTDLINGNLQLENGNATIGGTLDVGDILEVDSTTTLRSNLYVELDDTIPTHLVLHDWRMDRAYNHRPKIGTLVERCVGVRDESDNWVERVVFRQQDDGRKMTMIEANGTDSSGNSIWNAISSYVDADGTRGYTLTDPAAFCSTLHVGDRVEKDQSTAMSIADSSWKNICSVSLPAGTWIIEATAQYAANATGRRSVAISETTNAASATVQRETCNSITAINGASTFIHTGCTKVLAATTTIYLVGWQNSGAALNTYGYISAVRIK